MGARENGGQDDRLRVAIVGGGPGALTAAHFLVREGAEVTVYEQAPELGELGAGIGLSPNCVKILYALGLESELLRRGTLQEGLDMLRWKDGSVLSTAQYAEFPRRFGAPTLQIHRAHLVQVMHAALPAGSCAWDTASATWARTGPRWSCASTAASRRTPTW